MSDFEYIKSCYVDAMEIGIAALNVDKQAAKCGNELLHRMCTNLSKKCRGYNINGQSMKTELDTIKQYFDKQIEQVYSEDNNSKNQSDSSENL